MEPDERKRVGARIAQARRESGLTQRELAHELGVTTRSLQNYEAGAIVPWRHLRRIETVTHKRTGWLLDDGSGPGNAVSPHAISELLEAMEEHQALLREQLRLLRENTTELTQRRAGRTHGSLAPPTADAARDAG